ncbi:hypothetical protein [Viridibacterium curvum]|uniref:Uncharacterized protein n=1 Tax=Viridibacterium curvum TaxID=1101404 RepID=A0ABP9QIG5_9RHOO
MSVLYKVLLAGLFLMSAAAFAQQSEPMEEGPEVWKARAERAAMLRKDAGALQKKADERRKQDDIECRKSFFENACRDSARETWLEQVNTARAMEMEAVGLERSIRAHELALRERNRPKPRVPKAGDWVIEPGRAGSAPVSGDASGPRGATPRAPAAPHPLKRETEADKADKAARRASEAEAAKARAEQAQKDAARYAERRKAHAARQSSASSAKKP